MKKFIKTVRWNVGVFMLGIAYWIRDDVPMNKFDDWISDAAVAITLKC